MQSSLLRKHVLEQGAVTREIRLMGDRINERQVFLLMGTIIKKGGVVKAEYVAGKVRGQTRIGSP
jgi:hypothetical protein